MSREAFSYQAYYRRDMVMVVIAGDPVIIALLLTRRRRLLIRFFLKKKSLQYSTNRPEATPNFQYSRIQYSIPVF